jgi:hypothetical protein
MIELFLDHALYVLLAEMVPKPLADLSPAGGAGPNIQKFRKYWTGHVLLYRQCNSDNTNNSAHNKT